MAALKNSLLSNNEIPPRISEVFFLELITRCNFDKSKIENEIVSICEKVDDLNIAKDMLKDAMRCLSFNILNSIEKKAKEDTNIASISGINYAIAKNVKDLRRILDLRKTVFLKEEHYPPSSLVNGFEGKSLHIMASIKNELVGGVSIAFDGPEGIPLDKFIRIDRSEKKKIVEVDKLAIVNHKRKSELSFQLMWICYAVARYWGAHGMYIFTLSKKRDNISIYEKFGFKIVDDFTLFGNEKATALRLDFTDEDTYEKKMNTDQILRLAKKLLNRFSSIV
jgi:hypothetical protein